MCGQYGRAVNAVGRAGNAKIIENFMEAKEMNVMTKANRRGIAVLAFFLMVTMMLLGGLETQAASKKKSSIE